MNPIAQWMTATTRACVACALSVVLFSSALPSEEVEARAVTYQLDIPAESLDVALQALALASHHKLLYRADLVAGKTSHALIGTFTAEEAVREVLSGTNLEFDITPASVVLIKSKDREKSRNSVEVPTPMDPAATLSLPLSERTLADSQNRLLLAQAAQEQISSDVSIDKRDRNHPQTSAELSEIIVTAQKRPERLLSTAAPVTAITADVLSRTEAVRLTDYAAQVPGLNVTSDEAGETLVNLRGITTGSDTSSTVGYYIDDTPFGSSTNYASGGLFAPDIDPGDLQRIEVLRGPQGTLYGASSLGGLIKFVTISPSLDQASGRVAIGRSTIDGGGDGFSLRGMINAPLVKDTLGIFISGFDREDPGYINDPNIHEKDVNATRAYGGRVALLWRPMEDLSVTLSALSQTSSTNGTSSEDVDQNLRPIYGDLTQFRYTKTPVRIHDSLYNATVDYSLGSLKLTSITSYQTITDSFVGDDTGLFGALIPLLLPTAPPNTGLAIHDGVADHRFSEEFRLASASNQPLEWQAGVFFAHESSSAPAQLEPFNTITAAPVVLPTAVFTSDEFGSYTEYASFGDLTYHITSKFEVLAGLRYSYDDQHYLEPSSGSLAGGASVDQGKSTDSDTTFLVTPKYRFDDDNMIYARIASGYRPGGVNQLTAADIAQGAPLTFKPDSLVNYEVGYKGWLLHKTLTLELSAFDIEWNQIQITENFDGVGATGNGTKARSSGFEAASSWTPLHGLNLNANVAFTDAHLTENAPGVNAIAGEELPLTPRWAANVLGDYEFPLSSSFSGFVGGTVSYRGDRASFFPETANAPRPTIPAYTTVDLRAGLDVHGTEIEIYGKNVGDVRGIQDLISRSLAGAAPYAASIIQPRTVGVSLTQKF